MANTLAPAAPLDGEAVLPIEAARAWLRVDGEDEDDTIKALRDAAIDWVERHTARALAPRPFVWRASGFIDVLRPSISPIVSVTGIAYRDAAGADAAVVPGGWQLIGEAIVPAAGGRWAPTWAADGDVRVSLVAGYADISTEAPALLTAVKLMMAHLFANRSAVIVGQVTAEAPLGVTTLCGPFRTPVVR